MVCMKKQKGIKSKVKKVGAAKIIVDIRPKRGKLYRFELANHLFLSQRMNRISPEYQIQRAALMYFGVFVVVCG